MNLAGPSVSRDTFHIQGIFGGVCAQLVGTKLPAVCPNTCVHIQHMLTQVRKLAPKHMQTNEACAARHAHVTCANFSRQGEIVATYNDEVGHPAAAELLG